MEAIKTNSTIQGTKLNKITTTPIAPSADIAHVRKCKYCGKLLPISEFQVNKHCRGGYSPTCKTCAKERKSQLSVFRKQSSKDILFDIHSLTDEMLTGELARRGWSGEIRKVKVVSL